MYSLSHLSSLTVPLTTTLHHTAPYCTVPYCSLPHWSVITALSCLSPEVCVGPAKGRFRAECDGRADVYG
jgi:hypothetical protein